MKLRQFLSAFTMAIFAPRVIQAKHPPTCRVIKKYDELFGEGRYRKDVESQKSKLSKDMLDRIHSLQEKRIAMIRESEAYKAKMAEWEKFKDEPSI